MGWNGTGMTYLQNMKYKQVRECRNVPLHREDKKYYDHRKMPLTYIELGSTGNIEQLYIGCRNMDNTMTTINDLL